MSLGLENSVISRRLYIMAALTGSKRKACRLDTSFRSKKSKIGADDDESNGNITSLVTIRAGRY